MTLTRRLAVEALGTAILLAAIVGSGIAAERLAGGNVAIALLCNTLATAGVLVALIAALGPLSGAHFNPVVSIVDAALGHRPWNEMSWYVAAQITGAVAGVGLANLMYGLPLFFGSTHVRSGPAQWLSEGCATFGLIIVIFFCARVRRESVPYAVAAYITGAYWFTASTSFANPAVTIARSLSDTFAGIRPADVGGFVIAQLVGASVALAFVRWILSSDDARLREAS